MSKDEAKRELSRNVNIMISNMGYMLRETRNKGLAVIIKKHASEEYRQKVLDKYILRSKQVKELEVLLEVFLVTGRKYLELVNLYEELYYNSTASKYLKDVIEPKKLPTLE